MQSIFLRFAVIASSFFWVSQSFAASAPLPAEGRVIFFRDPLRPRDRAYCAPSGCWHDFTPVGSFLRIGFTLYIQGDVVLGDKLSVRCNDGTKLRKNKEWAEFPIPNNIDGRFISQPFVNPCQSGRVDRITMTGHLDGDGEGYVEYWGIPNDVVVPTQSDAPSASH